MLARGSVKLDSLTVPGVVYAESVAAGCDPLGDRLAVHQPRDLLAIEDRYYLPLLQVSRAVLLGRAEKTV
jgi:hypothetical protein